MDDVNLKKSEVKGRSVSDLAVTLKTLYMGQGPHTYKENSCLLLP